MVIYLLVIPFLVNKWKWLDATLNKFAIPIPKLHHIFAFLLSTGIILLVPNLSRKWEVYELFFACIFFLIFLNPRNADVVKGLKTGGDS